MNLLDVRQTLDSLEYVTDRRAPPDSRRLGQLRTGWSEGGDARRSYSREALRDLTWRNLGYRFGLRFGQQGEEAIENAFVLASGLFELRDTDMEAYSGSHAADQWHPQTLEDRLIHWYWLQRGGNVLLEVPIGAVRSHSDWAETSTRRRIDAVRIPDAPEHSDIFRSDDAPKGIEEMAGAAESESVEVIEAKRTLNRTVIGQAIVGVDLLAKQYGIHASPVVLCGRGDGALEWVCSQRGIEVVIVNGVT